MTRFSRIKWPCLSARLLATKGYEQMTMRDIVDELQIAKGTVYHYFDSNEQGGDALSCADVYADQGKPDFVLAYLLLTDASDEVKRDIWGPRRIDFNTMVGYHKERDLLLKDDFVPSQFEISFPFLCSFAVISLRILWGEPFPGPLILNPVSDL